MFSKSRQWRRTLEHRSNKLITGTGATAKNGCLMSVIFLEVWSEENLWEETFCTGLSFSVNSRVTAGYASLICHLTSFPPCCSICYVSSSLNFHLFLDLIPTLLPFQLSLSCSNPCSGGLGDEIPPSITHRYCSQPQQSDWILAFGYNCLYTTYLAHPVKKKEKYKQNVWHGIMPIHELVWLIHRFGEMVVMLQK